MNEIGSRYKAAITLVAALMLTAPVCSAQTLLWSEEFDYTGVPDSEVWSHDLGDWGWGNSELQDYTDSTNNVWVDGSNLVITVRRSGDGFSSGRIKTLDKLTFKYGTIEARIQTPDLGDGLWPAFWTLGNDFPTIGWPDCGEIDVMEMGNSSGIAGGTVNRLVGSAAHWERYGSHALYGEYKTLDSDIDGLFVTYRLEWTPTSITTYINDQQIWIMDISGGAGSDLEEFHKPHFFLLNMAVGGNYPGIWDSANITAFFPAEYKVDWIRIYDNGYTELGGSAVEGPQAAATNLFVNPGFESGKNGWSFSANGEASSDAAHSGSNSLLIDSTGASAWSSPNAYQIYPASAGEVFHLQGYMLTPSVIPDGSFGLFKIEFKNSNGANLIPDAVRIGTLQSNSDYPGAESTPHLDSGSAPGAWVFSQVQVEAPAGTAAVGFYLLNVNQSGTLIYFDSMQAAQVGDSAPFELSASVAGGSMQMRFPTQIGLNYQLAFKTSLTDAVWTPVETIVGDGTTNTVSYPVNDPIRFYRVVISN